MVRKTLPFALLALLIFFAAGCNSESDSSSENQNDTTQQAQESFEEQDYQLPAEFEYLEPEGEFPRLYDKFYPLGWSKDGKFAYLTEPADEATGFYFFSIQIVNLLNDKVVWEWTIDENHEIDHSQTNLKKVWEENYDEFKQALNQHAIVQKEEFKLGKLSFQQAGNDYKLEMQTSTEADEEFGIEFVNKINVQLVSPQLGTKKIFSKQEKDSFILDARIEGYFASPYEDRIAVLHTQETRGYEGPPNVVAFTISGADLKGGFTK